MADSSEERLLYVLKSRGPVTARDLGRALEITTAGAQQQLVRLAGLGFVSGEDRREGRGRPRKYWQLTERGHARFPDRHSDLTLDMLRSTEAVFGAEGLERLIRHREVETLAAYRAEMAGAKNLEERVAALAQIRTREGYMADWQRTDEGAYLLVENHCPICAAAAVCQGLCRSELNIFRAVLGPDSRVERTDHILAGARRCAYRISQAP